jgi:hypothetical protein
LRQPSPPDGFNLARRIGASVIRKHQQEMVEAMRRGLLGGGELAATRFPKINHEKVKIGSID